MLSAFQYYAPTNLRQAAELLRTLGPRARALAGGTALLVALERRQLSADAIVNLKHIPGLRALTLDPERGLHIGALVTLAELLRSPAARTHYPVLVETLEYVATPQVRNLATVGGSLCMGNPSADLAVSLLALDAHVRIYGPDGEHELALDSLFPTWGGTRLAPGEILTGVQIPVTSLTAHYQRFMVRAAMDVPLANLAIAIARDHDVISEARIVLGGNGPRPVRMLRAERALVHSRPDENGIEDAVQLVVADAYPMDDLRASREYRRALSGVMARRMLRQLLSETH